MSFRERGKMLTMNSVIELVSADQNLEIDQSAVFKNWNFQELGIGGLNKEFNDLFRRAFASRLYPQSLVEKLGIRHVKGILLHGPPGTGKTLIARQISKMLNGNEPKIVNGPEIFNKFVGGSEENVRNLFLEAENDQKNGDDRLHVIIFDEIDAICKKRGLSTSNGAGDNVVNQLLSKIDGVNSLNNLLIIGMTNRKDMIDEAVLRAGRLEVHIEIGLPDSEGRLQIFNIHTRKMRENGMMDSDVDLKKLAEMTKNYSGAEIEGLVKSAASFALFGNFDPVNIKNLADIGSMVNTEGILVKMDDFLEAISETKPVFGNDSIKKSGLIFYNEEFSKLYSSCESQIRFGKSSKNMISILLRGSPGCGKTSIATNLATSSGFPYVKLISPENFVGYSESAKIACILKVFENAYHSPSSLIVLDDIERLIEYSGIGPRFSNSLYQTLMVLMKRESKDDHKLVLIVTTSIDLNILEMNNFTSSYIVRRVEDRADIKNIIETIIERPICNSSDLDGFPEYVPIKRLVTVAEAAKNNVDSLARNIELYR